MSDRVDRVDLCWPDDISNSDLVQASARPEPSGFQAESFLSVLDGMLRSD